MRPRGDVPHSTHRSQNSRDGAPQLVTGKVAEVSAHSLRIVTALPTDRYGSRTQPGPTLCGSTGCEPTAPGVPEPSWPGRSQLVSGSSAGYATPRRSRGSLPGSCHTAVPLT